MADKPAAGLRVEKVIDVAHPGTSLPSATSKEIVVTNKPVLTDPMVAGAATSAPKTFTSKMRIEPLQHDTQTDEAPAASNSESLDDGLGPQSPDGADSALVEARKATEHSEAVNKLIESRQYYLPINQVQRRRANQLKRLLLAAAIIIGLAWTYLLLDAGIITLPGVTVPSHFFK